MSEPQNLLAATRMRGTLVSGIKLPRADRVRSGHSQMTPASKLSSFSDGDVDQGSWSGDACWPAGGFWGWIVHIPRAYASAVLGRGYRYIPRAFRHRGVVTSY